MHAVVVRVSIGDSEIAEKGLREKIVPQSRAPPVSSLATGLDPMTEATGCRCSCSSLRTLLARLPSGSAGARESLKRSRFRALRFAKSSRAHRAAAFRRKLARQSARVLMPWPRVLVRPTIRGLRRSERNRCGGFVVAHVGREPTHWAALSARCRLGDLMAARRALAVRGCRRLAGCEATRSADPRDLADAGPDEQRVCVDDLIVSGRAGSEVLATPTSW